MIKGLRFFQLKIKIQTQYCIAVRARIVDGHGDPVIIPYKVINHLFTTSYGISLSAYYLCATARGLSTDSVLYCCSYQGILTPRESMTLFHCNTSCYRRGSAAGITKVTQVHDKNVKRYTVVPQLFCIL